MRGQDNCLGPADTRPHSVTEPAGRAAAANLDRSLGMCVASRGLPATWGHSVDPGQRGFGSGASSSRSRCHRQMCLRAPQAWGQVGRRGLHLPDEQVCRCTPGAEHGAGTPSRKKHRVSQLGSAEARCSVSSFITVTKRPEENELNEEQFVWAQIQGLSSWSANSMTPA